MTQRSLAFDPRFTPDPTTLAGRAFDLLESRKGQWVDAREIAKVAGYAAWRTRLSELRTRYGFTIENQWRHVEMDGRKFRITEYRLL